MIDFRSAFLINFASTSGATLVQFIISLILARLLTPSEIGVYSITVVFVNIANVFRDFGVASYIQREKDLNNEKIRAAIGVLFTSTWVIAIILYFISNFVSEFFGYPEIIPVMRVLAMGFIFIPFSSLMMALMLREFEAGKLAWVTLAGTSAYAITCLSLAYMGFGTMSLAWANLANIIACALAYLPMRPKGLPWLPSFNGWRIVFNFGLGSVCTNAMGAINNALPDMLLGKIGTTHQVGLLSRANSTVNIFIQIAGSAVNFGSLSYIAQTFHRNESLSPLLNRATGLLTGFGWPALAMTALLGKDIVLTLYGVSWLGCVPAIPALALAAGIGMTFNYLGTAMTAVGRPYLAAIPVALMTVSRITLTLIYFPEDVATFSWVICGATLLSSLAYLYLQNSVLNYKFQTMLPVLIKSLLVTIFCAIVCYVILQLLPDTISSWQRLLILALPLMLTWYFSLKLTNHVILEEIDRFLKKYISTK